MSQLTIVLLVTLFMMVMFVWNKVPFGVTALFSQFVPSTAALAILVVFLTTLNSSGEITANRLILPLLGVMVAWKFRLPIGLGATTFATLNGFYEGIIGEGHPEYMISLMDPFKFAIIPITVLTLYCIFGWKLMPKDNAVDTTKLKKGNAVEKLPQSKQMIVYVVFAIVMLCLIFNQITGNFMYLAPAAGVIILIFTGCISAKDAAKDMTSDMIWMLAGVLVVADAIGASGAGEYNPGKVLKFTLPYMILAILSCAVSATIFYPLG